MSEKRPQALNPFGAAALAWMVPGAGHLALGRWQKGVLYFTLIVATFVTGWLASGGENVYFEHGRWHTLVQAGAGLMTFAFGFGSKVANPQHTVMGYFEIGTLYTMVAGLLNLLVVMDAVLTSLRLRKGAL